MRPRPRRARLCTSLLSPLGCVSREACAAPVAAADGLGDRLPTGRGRKLVFVRASRIAPLVMVVLSAMGIVAAGASQGPGASRMTAVIGDVERIVVVERT